MTLQRRMENVGKQQWKRFTINFALQIKECSPWQEHIILLARTMKIENGKCFTCLFPTITFWEICAITCEYEVRAWTRYIICHWIYYYCMAYVLCNVCDVIMCQCEMCLSYGRLFRTLTGNFQVQKWNANLRPKAKLIQCEHCTPNNDGLDLTEVWDKARSNTNTHTNRMCGNQGISKL